MKRKRIMFDVSDEQHRFLRVRAAQSDLSMAKLVMAALLAAYIDFPLDKPEDE